LGECEIDVWLDFWVKNELGFGIWIKN
jgi:hypothetical protein